MTDEQACKIIRKLIDENGQSGIRLAEEINMTPSNLNRKLREGTLRFGEALKILGVIGYDVTLKKRGESLALVIDTKGIEK